ncbi:MAG TPA: AsmA-like C-terminal region-containing protein [Vicinamibacterales bacterium]|nr:AsmA-like C-terminal region-containing protein [Vicinamibacterales bacterium]
MLIIAAATIAAVVLVAAGGLYWFFSGDGMRRALEQQATAWLGQPVRIKAARGQLFPRPGIGLSGVEVGEPVRLTLSSVDLSTDLQALLNRRIEDARVVISDSTIQMPLPFAIPEQDGSSKDEAVTQSAVRVISVREISLRDIHIRSRGREVRVSADSSLNGNHLTLSRFTADSGSTSLQVKGEAELEPRVDAKLQATANKIDIDELLAIAEAFTPERRAARRDSPSPPMKVVAQLKADTATAAGVQVTQFTTNMSLDDDRFSMSPMTFGLFGGSYEGSLTGRLGESMSVTLKSRLKGLNVAQLAAFGGSPDTITGTLSGEGTFSARGADMAAVLSSANGRGSASIVDGTIKRLNLVRTVVLFFGRPAPETAAATDQFERIDASFSLANQILRADSFSMHSRDADLRGSVTLNLETSALDGTIDMILSEELSAQAGTDLARYTQEGSRVVLPASMGGTLEQPRITINAAAALKRGITNEIGRRLRELFGR